MNPQKENPRLVTLKENISSIIYHAEINPQYLGFIQASYVFFYLFFYKQPFITTLENSKIGGGHFSLWILGRVSLKNQAANQWDFFFY